MKIVLTKKASVGAIQEQFRSQYPFLNVRFSDKKHAAGERILNGHYYEPGFRVSKIAGKYTVGEIEIHPWQQTGSVEETFKERFGLNVQIFRKQEEGWIETSASDFLSLYEQNEIGKHQSLHDGNVCSTREAAMRSLF